MLIRINAVRRLKTVILSAVAVAIVGAAALFAQTVLSDFPLADERYLWKSLTSFPDVIPDTDIPVPGIAQNNNPSNQFVLTGNVDLFNRPEKISKTTTYHIDLDDPLLDVNDEPVVDPVLGPLYKLKNESGAVVTAADEGYPAEGWEFLKEFHDLEAGECTFSHNGDGDFGIPKHRQCKAADGSMVAPPTGHLLNPVGVATERKMVSGQSVTGSAVYVVDQYNHRVQAFDFNGVPMPMAHPIGNGTFGSGTYSYPPSPTYPSGLTGSLLSEPYGIAVDRAGRILVADGLNQRVAIFQGMDAGANAGLPAFATHAAIAPGVTGIEAKPNQVVLSPNAEVLAPGSVPSGAAEDDRIVVTDWTHCTVQVYDTGFNFLWSLPTAASYASHAPEKYQHDACLAAEGTEDVSRDVPGPGEFVTMTGAAIDRFGHIYLADFFENSVQVFDRDGVYLGRIGVPGEATGDAVLLGPVGLTIDHLDRLAVTDSGHARVAFYTIAFPAVPPPNAVVATFQFQLDTTVAVDDFVMGFAEQVGAADGLDGLDSKGRFLATDPLKRRVLRFELPELGILNETANTGSGAFQVAVPRQKLSPVENVGAVSTPVTVTPVQPGSCLAALNCVKVTSVVPVAPAPLVNDIEPGQYVQYLFTYAPDNTLSPPSTQMPSAAQFVINAAGTGAVAEPVTVVARSACVGCSASAEVYEFDPEQPVLPIPSPTAPFDGWYADDVFVRITPGAGVESIQWWYEGVGALVYQPFVRETEVAGDYLDVPVLADGKSWVKFRPITSEGSIGGITTVPIFIDHFAPEAAFGNWRYLTPVPTSVGAQSWYNKPLTVDYTADDSIGSEVRSGIADPLGGVGSTTFSTEGRGLEQTVFVTDFVGHSASFNTETGNGGRVVNLDMTAPELRQNVTIPALTISASGVDVDGPYAVISNAVFAQWVADWVTDPDLNDGLPTQAAGSGVNPASATMPGGQKFRIGTTGFSFTVADVAGNVTPVALTVSITVEISPVTISIADRVTTYDGNPQPTSCSVTSGATPLSGVVTYTGTAPAYGPSTTAPTNAGTYSAVCSFEGTAQYAAAAPVSVTLTIRRRPATLRIGFVTRMYGDSFDDFGQNDVIVTGTTNADLLNFTMTTDAGPTTPASVVGGDRSVFVQLGDNPNYDLSADERGTLHITQRQIEVTADAGQGKVYGETDPALTWRVTSVKGLVNGDSLGCCLMRSGGETAGLPYQIFKGTLGNGNYAIAFIGAGFTIAKATPVITWSDPADITYPAALGPVQLNATASVPGSFAYAPPNAAGVVLAPGAGHPLSVAFTPTDATNYHSASATVQINVLKADQTITFGSLPDLLFGAPDFTVGATATSGLPVSFTASGACTIVGALVNVGSTGSCTITASQLGNAFYNAAPPVSHTFGIGKANQTITFAALPAQTYGDADFSLGATASSLLPVSYTTSGSCTLSGATIHITAIGSCTVTADQPGNLLFNAAPSVSRTFSIAPKPITVTPTPQSKIYGDTLVLGGAPSQFNAPGLVNGDTVTGLTLTSAGTGAAATVAGSPYLISASDAVGTGLGNYTISYGTNNLSVTTKTLTITANTPAPKVYGDTLTFAGTEFTSSGLVSSDTVSSVTLTSGGAAAAATVGGYAIVASSAVGSGLSNYSITYANGSLTVSPKALSITPNPANRTKVYNTVATFGTGEFTAVGLINGNTVTAVTLTSAGAPASAGVAGSPYAIVPSNAVGSGLSNYAITYTNGSLTVMPATPVITWANPAAIAFPTALNAVQLNATASVPGTLTYSPAAGITLPVGTHTLSVELTPTDNVNYTTATATVSLIVLSNRPPDAVNDAATVTSASFSIPVLANDTDPDLDTLTIASVGAISPAGAGTLSIVGSNVVFVKSATFTAATFTYTVSDGKGGTDTATVTLQNSSLTGFRTQTQGGWGAKPNGNNPAKFLADNFIAVYPTGVAVGGTKWLKFTAANKVEAFLPAGGTAGVLLVNGTNVTTSAAGVFAGQVLALQLSVDFSAAGKTRTGLGGLFVVSGKLAGRTVNEVLAMANAVIGGNLSALPVGVSLTDLNGIVDSINNNFVDGAANNGYLRH